MATLIQLISASQATAVYTCFAYTWDAADFAWATAEITWAGSGNDITMYESVSVTQKTSDRAGTFQISLPFLATADISAYTINTDVQIIQGTHCFRGFVQKPPVVLNGPIKILTLEGIEYAGKTQNIVVTESYTADYTVSYIVSDLVSKYLPWATANIQNTTMQLNIKFPDKFLWDCLEEICGYCSFNWHIDHDLILHFYDKSLKTATANITANNYYKGTANFGYDASKMVNKLWVKGAESMSASTVSQTVTVTTANITLDYKPYNLSVNIGTATMTVGIQNVDATGTYDFLLNFNEKLLIPDLTTSGTAVITYYYKYPLKILLTDNESIATYGQIEDILQLTTTDRDIALQQGLNHINKYKQPILTGSIQPFEGNYYAGDIINVNIPKLSINTDLVIKSVTYFSVPTKPIIITLQLENRLNDISDILKSFNQRLLKLESYNIANDNEVVEQYRSFLDEIDGVYTLQDDGMSYVLHDCIFAGMPYAGTFYP